MYRSNLFYTEGKKSTADIFEQPNEQSPYFQLMHNPLVEKLFSVVPAFICVLDMRTQRYIYASPNMMHLFGYDHEDLTGSGTPALPELCIEEDRMRLAQAESDFMDAVSACPPALRSNLKSVIGYRIKRSDDSVIGVQQHKTIMETDIAGNPLLVMIMLSEAASGRKNPDFCASIIQCKPGEGWINLAVNRTNKLLSNREREILQLLAKGKSSKIIASEISISVNTVNNHRKNMLLKTGANNIAELVNYGLSQGII
jgi:DNA-binding CsgD family transcriptional regulator